jgi:hypothetical protein
MWCKTSVMSKTRDFGSTWNLANLASQLRMSGAAKIQRFRFEPQTAVNPGLCLRRSRRIVGFQWLAESVKSNSRKSMRSQREITAVDDADHVCVLG